MRIRYNTYNNKNHLFYKNRQINDNLEQQAQALFKSWFVDFEPFKDGKFVESELGMIPEGCRVGKAEDFIILILVRPHHEKSKYGFPVIHQIIYGYLFQI